MKGIFWRGLLLLLSFFLLLWAGKKIIFALIDIWKNLYNLLTPLQNGTLPISVLNVILLVIFSLICTLLVIIITGLLFSIKIKGKSLTDLLLKYFSQIPGIKSLVKLISQITEASDSFTKKKNKLALYNAPSGKKILGIVRLKEIELIHANNTAKNEKVMSFYEAFTPYIFSGKPYLVNIDNLYEITNLTFEEYLKYVATAGLFFKLPKKIILRRIKSKKTKNSKSAN